MRPIFPVLGAALAIAGINAAFNAASAAQWALDPDNSSLIFEATAMGSTIEGQFNAFETDITFDPDDLASASVVTRIDITSVDIAIKDGPEQLQGKDWFDAETYPEATFTSTGFEAKGDNNYNVTGDLTIKGVTEATVMPVSIIVEGDRAGANGELSIDRHTFNIGEGQWSSGNTVGSEVIFKLVIEATRQ